MLFRSMIVNFSVENFGSIKERQTLSFEATYVTKSVGVRLQERVLYTRTTDLDSEYTDVTFDRRSTGNDFPKWMTCSFVKNLKVILNLN